MYSIPVERIIINQFSVGYPFWEIQSVLAFLINLGSLPNHQNQIILLYTSNFNESIEEFNFNIAQVSDITISTNNYVKQFNRSETELETLPAKSN